MATYLQLCQDVARESGTVGGATISSVTGNTGAVARLVQWTADAWRDVQRVEPDWLWMQGTFSGETVAGTREYSAADLGISSRFGRWLCGFRKPFWCYLTGEGQQTEQPLAFVEWPSFETNYGFGAAAAATGRPGFMSINPQGEVVLYPKPDAVYTIRGNYQKAPQTLAADGDVPEAPEAYHDAIKWRALILMGVHDEAVEQVPSWDVFYRKLLAEMRVAQKPALTRASAWV